MVFFQIDENAFIRFAIVKKTSQKGGNITKDNYQTLFKKDMEKVLTELSNEEFEIF